MWSFKLTALIFSLSYYSVTSVNVFVCQDKELIYNWKATIEAGTPLPTPHASVFILHGKIYLQSDSENSTNIKIADLTYKLYNGALNHQYENEAHDLPVPEEAADLQNVFKIVYNNDGLVEGIVTEKTEKEFSRNIKRAIATILQVNSSVVTRDYQRSESFVASENSLFGHVLVDYTIHPQNHDGLEVHKQHDMPSVMPLYKDSVSNSEFYFWHPRADHDLMHDSKKIYSIVKENNQPAVKKIQAIGNVVYYPYQGKSVGHYILVEQTFQLEKAITKEKEYHVESGQFEQSLIYHTSKTLEDGFLDVTNSRRVRNYENLLVEAGDILNDIPVYLEEDHINTKEPDTKRGMQINRLERVLSKFNNQHLEKLEKTLSPKSLDVFYHMLPLIGTRATTLHVKNLIINKMVNEETIIVLLQNLHENVAPSVDLLKQMEPLIHLNDSFSWEIRKIALLSFGSLIHKSYIYTRQYHGYLKSEVELQEPYKQYVEEYANRLTAEKDYETQMVYVLSLRNMKLSLVIKYLEPAFTGKLSPDDPNQHIRLLSLWAVAPMILLSRNSATLIETFWPILTNRRELTEMRILAYYVIMKSEPNQSFLRNIFNFMLTETNDEVYNFHYTYMQSVIGSTNAANAEMRVRFRQVMKFSPPSRQGVSSARYYDYSDASFGYGVDIEEYIIETNRSRVLGVAFKTHHFSRDLEDFMIYLKLHAGQRLGVSFTNSIAETFISFMFRRKRVDELFNGNGNHIEAAIMKRDQTINCYYFDKNNFEGVRNSYVKFFQQSTTTKKILSVRYHSYQRVLIPTDLGFPAVWEYMMPEVTQSKLNLKEISTTLHIENRYVSWMHFRYGLSFYNSIIDVWQGVNRYHAYDAALPITLELELHIRDSMDFQLSWKKNENSLLNIAGMRSHVKHMVVVMGENNQNILKQSSPNSKAFHPVDYNKASRFNHTLLDVDDINTGHRWFMGIFDSNLPYNKSFNQVLQTFIPAKKVNSPFEKIALAYLHFRTHSVLLPYPRTYGLILRVEPSLKHDVTKIVFGITTPFYDEALIDFYLGQCTVMPLITYSIENDKGNLKTWELFSKFDFNKDHTLENLEVNLTRVVRGEKLHKICVKGEKKWLPNSVTAELTALIGNVDDDDHCSNDQVIDVTMHGNPSSEQLEGIDKYESCRNHRSYFGKSWSTPFQCEIDVATLRHYEYLVTTKNVSKKLQNDVINILTSYYQSDTTVNDLNPMVTNNVDKDTTDDKIKVDVVFPIEVDKIDVQITTHDHRYDLNGLPTNCLRWFGVSPDNLVFPFWFAFLHKRGLTDHCLIHSDHITAGEKTTVKVVPNSWTLYLQENFTNPHQLLVRIDNSSLSVKVVGANHTIEAVPHGDTFQLLLDGQQLSLEERNHEGWVYYLPLEHDLDNSVVLFFPDIKLGLQYSPNYVNIIFSKLDHFTGRCIHDF